MKIRFLLLLFICFLFSSHTYSAVRAAKVVQFTGDVKWRKKVVIDKLMNRLSEEMGIESAKIDTSYENVRINLFISTEDWIKTGKESEVYLLLNDGSKLRIGENSLFSITAFLENQDASHHTVAYIRLGSVVCNIIKYAGKKGSFKLCTPTATCAIRGTFFETAVSDNGSTIINVIEGIVDVGLVGIDIVIQVHANTQAKIEKDSKTIATTDIPSEKKADLMKIVKKSVMQERTTEEGETQQDIESDIIDEITQKDPEPMRPEIPIEEIIESVPSPSSPD